MKLRVGVLRGGPSSEYDESLKSGGNVLSILRDELNDKYEPLDIFIDKVGSWHMYGKPISITDLQKNVDVIWNALHGHFGEDGQAQRLLEMTGIPFTGSGAIPSAYAGNKMTQREILEKEGIRVPAYMVISSFKKINENFIENGMAEMTKEYYVDDVTKKIFHTFAPYWVLKPKINHNKENIFLAKTLNGLKEAVEKSINHNEDIIVEEYVRGVNATSFVIDGYRDTDLYTTIPHDEITNDVHKNIGRDTVEMIGNIASQVHKVLGLNHYSQIDFLIHKNGLVYVVDARVLPQTGNESILNKSLESHGSKMSEFVNHVLGRVSFRK